MLYVGINRIRLPFSTHFPKNAFKIKKTLYRKNLSTFPIKRKLLLVSGKLNQYIPPMPPIEGSAGAAGSFSGISATTLSVVSRVAATEAAF